MRINEDLLREVLRIKENNPQPVPTREQISLNDWFKHIREENKKVADLTFKK